jgi:glycosyltransferase involved in cell wall biosynthesis
VAETLTVFFPVYRDEPTVERVTDKALDVCRRITDDFEVVIVDDGSPDRAGAIADELAARHPPRQEPGLRRCRADGPGGEHQGLDLPHRR